jgi:5-(carboxyamino)imidazole ribonucleotide synthase
MKIGVLGGGQLGRMLALAGYRLGFQFRFLDPAPDATAGQLAELVTGRYDDPEALERFAEGLDLVTWEFENVPVATARYLAERVPVYPPPQALETAQDRLLEKTFFRDLGIPTPTFAPIDSLDGLQAAAGEIGLPAVLKTRREGYDGKGQRVLRHQADLQPAWDELGERPLILEAFVPFERELSIIAARDRQGRVVAYPLVENVHQDGILRRSVAPAETDRELALAARDAIHQTLQALEYVGVLAIEFFEHAGSLYANEMAPRVHNSGHWTVEGSETSQFEQHLRAVAGLPLGTTAVSGFVGMLNLIGERPDFAALLRLPGLRLHWYGKEPRPGRKVGHVTIGCFDRIDLAARLAEAARFVPNPTTET